MHIQFTKMHGLGNDFVMIDNLLGKIKLTPKQVECLCDRHTGIGADGVILLEKKKGVDCFMNYYNSDGTIAEMCGNGVRCTAGLFRETTKSKKKHLLIGTRAGSKEIEVHSDGTYSVNMGKPVFLHSDFPTKSMVLEGLNFDFVSMGNPHAVTFIKDIKRYDLKEIGPKVENSKYFPRKINVELVEKVNNSHLKVIVWERGCGATLACGTGACGVYAIAVKKRLVSENIDVELPGGILKMTSSRDGEVVMRGRAEKVFQATYTL